MSPIHRIKSGRNLGGEITGQELANMTMLAFDYADKYRTPVIILQDGMMGQMMEPVVFPEPVDLRDLPQKPWVLDGAKGRPSRIIKSLFLDPSEEEDLNWRLSKKYSEITEQIQQAAVIAAIRATIKRILNSPTSLRDYSGKILASKL